MMNLNLSLDSVFHHIRPKDRTFFVRQLSVMISGGVPLAQALSLLGQQVQNDHLRQIVRVMIQDVEHGQSFSTTAARFPELFDEVMVAMIRTGEVSGQLEQILKDMAEHSEAQLSFTTKVRNALIYPTFVLIVMVIVAIILSTVVIPRLSEVFESSGVSLPVATRILIGVSGALLNYWYIFLIVVLTIFFTVRAYLITPEGRMTLYTFQSSMPIIRDLVMNSYLVRFTSVMAMLSRSGVSITEAMRIVSASMINPLWSHAINAAREEVERGIPLSAALSRHPVFPVALTQMIGVGEQTGNMDSVLETMSHYYQEQTDATIKALTALIEPIVLLVVAVGVAFVVISVILPIYGLADQI